MTELYTVNRFLPACHTPRPYRHHLLKCNDRAKGMIWHRRALKFWRRAKTDANVDPEEMAVLALMCRHRSLRYFGPQFVNVTKYRQIYDNFIVVTLEDAQNRFSGQEFHRQFMFNSAKDLLLVARKLGFAHSEDVDDGEVWFHYGTRQRTSGITALMIYLHRLTFKRSDLAFSGAVFGMSASEMSSIVAKVADSLYARFGHSLRSENLKNWSPYFEQYNQVIRDKFECVMGDAFVEMPEEIRMTFGFVDGTFLKTTRPENSPANIQRFNYDGHNKAHGLKFYAITCPNGLVLTMGGPFPGASNDLGMIRDDGLEEILALHAGGYKVLGDAIFPNAANIVRVPNAAEALARDQHEIVKIARMRSGVEHTFRHVRAHSPFLSDSLKLKKNARVGCHWINATFLMNLFACMYGHQQATFFEFPAPSLDEFFNIITEEA